MKLRLGRRMRPINKGGIGKFFTRQLQITREKGKILRRQAWGPFDFREKIKGLPQREGIGIDRQVQSAFMEI